MARFVLIINSEFGHGEREYGRFARKQDAELRASTLRPWVSWFIREIRV